MAPVKAIRKEKEKIIQNVETTFVNSVSMTVYEHDEVKEGTKVNQTFPHLFEKSRKYLNGIYIFIKDATPTAES